MIPVEEALARILALAGPVGTERVALRRAAGRVLAEAVAARLTQPPFDASAMDGYAIRLADLAEQYAAPLPVSQRIPAGVAPTPLLPGTAARIFTGAELPSGADCVVMQENVQRHADTITLTQPAQPGASEPARPPSRKCRKDGRTTYTDQPCPQGSQELPVEGTVTTLAH